MAWTGHFVETNYEERAEFLYHFLKMYEICTKDTEKAFSDTLKFLLGGMMLRKEPRYISEGVQASENYSTDEHTIPCKVLTDYLMGKIKDGNTFPTKEFLSEFIEKLSGIGKITKAENDKLSKIGLKQKLPEKIMLEDIITGSVDHAIRYEKAGIVFFEKN